MEFTKDWILCLKSIHFENKFKPFQSFKISFFGRREIDDMEFVDEQELMENFPTSKSDWITGYRQIDLLANHPNHFIICCDICENSVLSGSPVQILKYFPCEKKNETKFDIEFPNNDFKKL